MSSANSPPSCTALNHPESQNKDQSTYFTGQALLAPPRFSSFSLRLATSLPPSTPLGLNPTTSCAIDSLSSPYPTFSFISDLDSSFEITHAKLTELSNRDSHNLNHNPCVPLPCMLFARSFPHLPQMERSVSSAWPRLALMQSNSTPCLTHSAKLDTAAISTVAHIYSPHFPSRHCLDAKFVMEYSPGAVIGGGAFGFVVTATHRVRKHEVAVKFIDRSRVPAWGWCRDPVFGNVPTEVMLLRKLEHPGIIKFLDFFQDDHYFYLVQELHGSPWKRSVCTNSHGESTPLSPVSPFECGSEVQPSPGFSPNMNRRNSHDLFECIEEHERLSEPQARDIFAQVVDVVCYLDNVGVLHRDIKDENILIDREFRIKLIDFGSASIMDSNRCGARPRCSKFRGTIAYAPAEIFRGVKMHQAEPADVWAMGILLSCLICGRRPFTTTEDAAAGRFMLPGCKIRSKGETHSESHNTVGTVSAECWDLLRRCLDPDPDARANISEVAAHPWLAGHRESSRSHD